jgi:hypothetical protein
LKPIACALLASALAPPARWRRCRWRWPHHRRPARCHLHQRTRHVVAAAGLEEAAGGGGGARHRIQLRLVHRIGGLGTGGDVGDLALVAAAADRHAAGAVGNRAGASATALLALALLPAPSAIALSPPATVLVPMAMLLRLLPSAWKPSATLLSP